MTIRMMLAAAAFILAGAEPSLAQNRQPLLIEGKTELFQRILTRPGARIGEEMGASDAAAVDALTPLYVYDRREGPGGDTYLEVGTDAKGNVLGFLPETQTTPWRHALVLAFSERVGRERTLFFEEKADLDAWLDAPDLETRAAAAREAIDADALEPGSPIVSIEPEAHVDFETNFYMLPILSTAQRRLASGFRARDVEVASVTLNEEPAAQPLKRRINPEALADFRAGVMFVIDASSSMGPYIDRTRAVMDRVLGRVEAEGLSDKVRFGLVAYRDDPAETEGIEFLTRTFADPNEIGGSRDFSEAVAPLEASEVSTRAFAEDSFAAIDAAFKTVDWSGFGARYLILVTDASSRTARAAEVAGEVTPPSATGLSVDGMRQLIRLNKAALYALHLRSPAGEADH
ncbi:MAG: vWA domain-containing protein, partial [Pseudomonadota bacterium]